MQIMGTTQRPERGEYRLARVCLDQLRINDTDVRWCQARVAFLYNTQFFDIGYLLIKAASSVKIFHHIIHKLQLELTEGRNMSGVTDYYIRTDALI